MKRTDVMSETDLVADQIASDTVDAALERTGDHWMLTMTREFRHPMERVWPMLTEPDRLARWSPVVPDRSLATVGPATSRETFEAEPIDASVLRSNPPRELIHRLGDHLLRWTLTPTPAGSRLTLEHTFGVYGDGGKYAAGWHICLAVLTVVIDGHDVARVVGDRAAEFGWSELHDRYQALLN
jgi:uncharacterized protein YndB with AHSA1/START domain